MSHKRESARPKTGGAKTETVLHAIKQARRRSQLLVDSVLEAGDDMMAVIVAHTAIQRELMMLLRYSVPCPDELDPKMSYQSILSTIMALELLDNSFRPPLNKLGALRNQYAHDMNFELTDKQRKEFFEMLPPAAFQAAELWARPSEHKNLLRYGLWELHNYIANRELEASVEELQRRYESAEK